MSLRTEASLQLRKAWLGWSAGGTNRLVIYPAQTSTTPICGHVRERGKPPYCNLLPLSSHILHKKLLHELAIAYDHFEIAYRSHNFSMTRPC